MPPAPSELSLPVARGARVVALELLAAADQTSHRLAADARDDEALHDFRVAVRRLRSWIRAFDDELALRKRDKKQLRAIAQATNPGRDVEVQLEWLRAASKPRGKLRREGAAWVIAILEQRFAAAEKGIGSLVTDQFTKLRGQLEQSFIIPADVALDPAMPTLAVAIADRMDAGVAEMQQALDAVHAITDDTASHEARIAAKRLRYLIEPAAPHVDGGGELLRQLKKLQDDLGELHDRHVMARELDALGERSATLAMRATISTALGEFGSRVAHDATEADVSAGEHQDGEADLESAARSDVRSPAPARTLVALAHRLRDDLVADYARAHERWLEGRHRRLDEQLTAFAARLRADFAG